MLRGLNEIVGYRLHALDSKGGGEIGHVETFYIEDDQWIVRYLVVNTGNWLLRNRVLLSPLGISAIDHAGREIRLNLTKEQIEKSPNVETTLPVSRQREEELYAHYRWPYYWTGAGFLGTAAAIPMEHVPQFPDELPIHAPHPSSAQAQSQDPHLRDTETLRGYHLEGTDGRSGHLEDFLFDDRSWCVSCFIGKVNSGMRNWFHSRLILLSTELIERISWRNHSVQLHLTREQILESPELNAESLRLLEQGAELTRRIAG